MKIILVLTFLLLVSSFMPACNTMEGVGKDTKKAGQNIENAADRNK